MNLLDKPVEDIIKEITAIKDKHFPPKQLEDWAWLYTNYYDRIITDQIPARTIYGTQTITITERHYPVPEQGYRAMQRRQQLLDERQQQQNQRPTRTRSWWFEDSRNTRPSLSRSLRTRTGD